MKDTVLHNTNMKPTAETYSELQEAFDMFNRRLFDDELPACLITLQREKRSCGYFSAERFGNRNGEKTDEIALNPSYFATVPLVEIMQTLVHEMTHLWQHHKGTPGRGRYHNTEWAEKMESIGLVPSSTGRPGGKTTGDAMADYPFEGGHFLEACAELLTHNFKISWYDRFSSPAAIQAGQDSFGLSLELPEGSNSIAALEGVELIEGAGAGANKSNRAKYTCSCGVNVWGKPGLKISCEDCGELFAEN